MKTLWLRTSVRIMVVIIAVCAALHSRGYAQTIPPQNHEVSLDSAAHFVLNFKNNSAIDTIKGGFFWKGIFSKILAQPQCVGIRIYYAKLDNGTPTLVLVGVDANGKDMEKGVIGELIRPCPPFCDTASTLYKQ